MPVSYFPPIIDATQLNGQNGFQIDGSTIYASSGQSICSADINDDGVTDLIIGGTFASYVIFGGKGVGASGILSLATLNGHNGFTISINNIYTSFVSAIGDINHDGIDDLAISAAQGSSINPTVTVYVVFGRTSLGSSGTLDLSSLNGSNGFAIVGINQPTSSISGIGDVNHDGIDDFIIGVSEYSFYQGSKYFNWAGACYILFGKSSIGSSGTINVGNINGSNGFVIIGMEMDALTGASVSQAGDVNADGIADFIIGAPSQANDPYLSQSLSIVGDAYVIFGHSGIGSSGMLLLSILDGSNGFLLRSFQHGYSIGSSISGGEDVNGDGITDIIIGVAASSPLPSSSYVVFGKAGIARNGTFNLAALNGINGFSVTGSDMGRLVSMAGDINADGIADFLVNSQSYTFLVFGQRERSSSSLDLTTLNGQNGFAFTQDASTVRGIGDLNDDGVDDFAIGVSSAIPNGIYSAGITYVVFGDISPTLHSNRLTLSQGQTILLDQKHLNATDPRYASGSLLFTATHIKHGYFTKVNESGSITQFYQQDIQSKQILFVHDGSRNAPHYNISVNNIGFAFAPSQASIISFNFAPLLVNNSLVINQGSTNILTSIDLYATDVDHNPQSLIFIASDIQHGQFSLVNQSGIAIDTFLQSQISQHQIEFIHDGSIFAPSYSISVSDGIISNINGPQPVIVNFDTIPLLVRNQLSLNQGQTIIITANNISATHPNILADDLFFTISNVLHGHFEQSSLPGIATSTFTQQEIVAGLIRFIHDGSAHPPSYELSVSDGRITVGPVSVQINFNFMPILINNKLTLNEGETVLITSDDLSATDVETPAANLLFMASDVVHGYFATNNQPGTPTTIFYQRDILTQNLNFVAIGSSIPGYNIAVNDGNITSSTVPATISFNLNTQQSSSISVRNTIISSTISGVLGLTLLILRIYIGRKSLKKLHEAYEEIEAEHIRFIANKIFERINTTGIFGYRSKATARAYIRSIEQLIKKIEAQGVDMELTKMSVDYRALVVNEVAKQVSYHVKNNHKGKLTNFCCNFFKPDITPKQLIDESELIAMAIKPALQPKAP